MMAFLFIPYTKQNHVLILHLKMLTNYLKENYTYAFFFYTK